MKQGGQHHGLDNIMDDRNGDSFFGSLLPSLVPELAKPHVSTEKGKQQNQFIEKGFVRDGL
ncbi:MAG: hypothetical protein H0X47_04985 [Nitrospirales bacterium]|nr:hypothetical protein [Nitrospirales bacterium]